MLSDAHESSPVRAAMLSKSKTYQSRFLRISNKIRTGAVGVDRDQSIVCGAASKSTGTRVQSALHLGTLWRVKTSIDTAIRSLVRGLEVASLTLLVGVVLDEEVPCHAAILRGPDAVGRDSVVVVLALVVSSFDEQSLVASKGKTSGEGTSTGARSDNDIFVAIKINGNSEGGEGCKRADYLMETHYCKRMLILSISLQAKERRDELLTGSYPKRLNRGNVKACLKKSS
jgi:hypothetical protein